MTSFLRALLAVLALVGTIDVLAAERDFELYKFDRALFRTSDVREDVGVRVLAIDFFSLACEPCKNALPEWSRVATELASRGLRVVVVALPTSDDPDASEKALSEWFEAHPVPFPVVFDRYSVVAERYGVVKDGTASLPQVFVLDRRGALVTRGKTPADVLPAIRGRLTP